MSTRAPSPEQVRAALGEILGWSELIRSPQLSKFLKHIVDAKLTGDEASIKAYSIAGLDPKIMGMGPVSATRLCLQKAGWSHEDVDLMEINEAFAAQAIAVNKQMGWDTSKINVNGGAIALGHPIGASGARVLVSLLHEMVRRDAKKGLAALCIGGGMGVALAVER